MKIEILAEPSLEFAYASRHIDPRFGIDIYGPADLATVGKRVVRVGIVGSPSDIDGVARWLERCREPIAGKASNLTNIFPEFPGFCDDKAFHATVVLNGRLQRTIPERKLGELAGLLPDAAARQATELYLAELSALDEEPDCDVVICARPAALPEHAAIPRQNYSGPTPIQTNFHDYLKAKAMIHRQPLQVIKRETWDAAYKPPRVEAGQIRRSLQDEASRAWNIHTALYYKAGGVPWRLSRDSTDLATCYVGVAFYRSDAHGNLHTSIAQVFNERGDGVIVRGAQVRVPKEDRQPHLTQDDSRALLDAALDRYYQEHKTMPARVVLHKSSAYSDGERRGLWEAAEKNRIAVLELLWLPSTESTRVFRSGTYAPLRGTMLSVGEQHHSLYTTGSVPFYRCYPGWYVPQPLGLRLIDTESSPTSLAEEILALTKMNWNQTRLDGRLPITLLTAEKVGQILRHVTADQKVAARYAYYM